MQQLTTLAKETDYLNELAQLEQLGKDLTKENYDPEAKVKEFAIFKKGLINLMGDDSECLDRETNESLNSKEELDKVINILTKPLIGAYFNKSIKKFEVKINRSIPSISIELQITSGRYTLECIPNTKLVVGKKRVGSKEMDYALVRRNSEGVLEYSDDINKNINTSASNDIMAKMQERQEEMLRSARENKEKKQKRKQIPTTGYNKYYKGY